MSVNDPATPGPPTGPGHVPSTGRRPPEVRALPLVELKLRDWVTLPQTPDGVELSALPGAQGVLNAVFGAFRAHSAYSTTTPAQLASLIQRAHRVTPDYVPPRFENLLHVRVPTPQVAAVLAEALALVPSVESAEQIRHVSAPSGPVTGDEPELAKQLQHLKPPDGVNSEALWDLGVNGDGVRIAVVDWGYHDHEELPAVDLVFGTDADRKAYGVHHGTAALGIVAAADNTKGGLGVAPAAKALFATVYLPDPDDDALPDALTQTMLLLDFGDVLLLEQQYADESDQVWPIETRSGVLLQLQLAHALGIIVVEPAGNGWKSVDAEIDDESGAIMVGSIDPASDARSGGSCGSNYGMRVNCHAIDRSIYTCGGDAADTTTHSYTDDFGGTSGASAIVAGAACLLQSYAIAKYGFRLSPAQMRTILSTNGWSPANPATELVGVMPDLGKCVKALPATREVWIRSFIGDDGSTPKLAIGQCPDIHVLPKPAPPGTDPFSLPGISPAGWVLPPIPWPELYAYVQGHNRGAGDARFVMAELFSSPPTPAPLPSTWRYLGSTLILEILRGRSAVSRLPVAFQPGFVWRYGGFGLVAMLSAPGDPAPDPSAITDEVMCERFFRENNNVASRTVWLNMLSGLGRPVTQLPWMRFQLPGNERFPRRLLMVLRRGLPRGGNVTIELPHFVEIRGAKTARGPLGHRIALDDPEPLRFEVELPAGSAADVTGWAEGVSAEDLERSEIEVRAFARDRELGMLRRGPEPAP